MAKWKWMTYFVSAPLQLICKEKTISSNIRKNKMKRHPVGRDLNLDSIENWKY